MIGKCLFALATAALLVAGQQGFAQAEDASALTAEELQERFNNQRTRGLSIAPTAPTADTSSETATAATTTATTTVTAPESTVAYVDFEEDAVNFQISFDFDSAALREDQKPNLATLCEVINGTPEGGFRIVGHTDASGSASYNERLSLLRAQEVKRHLVTECGIPEQRLEAVGVGETFPLDSDDPNADINRRVEFQAMS